jgi:hypothetical protein
MLSGRYKGIASPASWDRNDLNILGTWLMIQRVASPASRDRNDSGSKLRLLGDIHKIGSKSCHCERSEATLYSKPAEKLNNNYLSNNNLSPL